MLCTQQREGEKIEFISKSIPMGVFDTLKDIIGSDVESGKFSKEIYSQFVKSLGNLAG